MMPSPTPIPPFLDGATVSTEVKNGTGKFVCDFDSCGKSFIRKEHLVRHAQSHNQAVARHVCRICLKEFTRSDSLQRHAIKHGENLPNASGRSKRACYSCHASKTKCDGNLKCSRCVKRNIECIYDGPSSGSQDTTMVDGQASDHEGMQEPRSIIPQMVALEHEEQLTAPVVHEPVPAAPPQPQKNLTALSRFSWLLSSRIETNKELSTTQTRFRVTEEDPVPLSQTLAKRYTDLYYTYFHFRWPILHCPTYEAYGPNILISSIYMIGAWLNETKESRDYAIQMHSKMTAHVLRELHRATSSDIFQQTLPAKILQAGLLNVIFGLYSGEENLIFQSVILRNTLVAVLREIDFFTPEKPFEKANSVGPFRLVMGGERQRLAAYLFKIDAYISLLRGHPSSLKPEELHFPLPCTFGLYNADGLSVCEARFPTEPVLRAQISMRDFILDRSLDPSRPVDGLMLVEDIQIGLSATASDIWQMWENLRRHPSTNPDPTTNTSTQQVALRATLRYWAAWLAQIPFRQANAMAFGREQQEGMRFYYGMEDESEPGWQMSVFTRIKGLVFDAIMLYHLLGTHLNTDTRVLRQLAKDYASPDLLREYGKPYEVQKMQRESAAREWSSTRAAREALCHAAAVLVSYSNLSGLENKTVDPIAYVALSTASLVIWAYCTFGTHECEVCNPESRTNFRVLNTVELTLWGELVLPDVLRVEKEVWVEGGGGRVALVGTQVCACNGGFLVGRFRGCLPEGWNLSRYGCG